MRWTPALVIVAAALLAGEARADEERVLPAALDGDPALVARVGEELARRGVTTGTGDEVIAATLTQEGDAIRVALRDPQGRTTERVVSTVDTAAALVESWARRDLADPLLAPRAPPPPPPPPLPEPPPSVAMPAVIPPPPSPWTPVLRLGGETWNRSLWAAASGGACARVGAMCLGGALRLARQLEPWQETFEDRGWRPRLQTDVEGMFTVELPISLGRPVLLVGLGAGIGWRFDGQDAQGGLRGEARVALALPLWSRLALEAGVTAAVAPAPDEFDPMFPGPRPTERQLRVGFGLRWGLP